GLTQRAADVDVAPTIAARPAHDPRHAVRVGVPSCCDTKTAHPFNVVRPVMSKLHLHIAPNRLEHPTLKVLSAGIPVWVSPVVGVKEDDAGGPRGAGGLVFFPEPAIERARHKIGLGGGGGILGLLAPRSRRIISFFYVFTHPYPPPSKTPKHPNRRSEVGR